MKGFVLIILMKFRKIICNRGWGLLFLFLKYYLKEITFLWCILLYVYTIYILYFIGWEVIYFCCKKIIKIINYMYIYLERI